jgi:hypothetical protein
MCCHRCVPNTAVGGKTNRCIQSTTVGGKMMDILTGPYEHGFYGTNDDQ